MDLKTFREKSLPLLKLYRDDYIILYECFFEEMNIDESIVHDIINWLCEKPLKEFLDEMAAGLCKDEFDQMIDIVDQSRSFEEANRASHQLFHE